MKENLLSGWITKSLTKSMEKPRIPWRRAWRLNLLQVELSPNWFSMRSNLLPRDDFNRSRRSCTSYSLSSEDDDEEEEREDDEGEDDVVVCFLWSSSSGVVVVAAFTFFFPVIFRRRRKILIIGLNLLEERLPFSWMDLRRRLYVIEEGIEGDGSCGLRRATNVGNGS